MDIKPIHTDSDLAAALSRVEALWGAQRDTSDGDELEILSILTEKYEA
jgi:HTH-type transcriptional regulator/antitoxin HigA